MNDGLTELIKRKIVGLFHDPPWKPWVISGEIGIDSFKCKEEIRVINLGKHAHEKQGLTVAMKILNASADEIEELMNYVRNSDILSAALDRYLNVQEERTGQMKKVNILNPTLEYTLKEKPSNIDGFVCEIRETSEKLRKDGLTLLYNYLYGNIELIWYKYNDKALPLADTRVKTYSVFDHLYSTVSLLNWFVGKAFEGYLVKVDIPAVQDIISRSRKIYDLWGGSWLVSALLFLTILPFIDEYGADVVLSPFMGLNPFFHTYLRSKLKRLNIDPDKYDYMTDHDATQPVMPATAFLVLPKSFFKNKEEIKEKIRDYYLNAWDTIVEAVINSGEVDGKIKKELEKIRSYPIVPIRVSVKDNVRLEIKKYKNEEERREQEFELVKEFDRLFREDFEEPVIKFSYGTPSYPLINRLSTLLYKEGKLYKQWKLYKQCTNCGILPAFVWKEENKTYVLVEEKPDLEEVKEEDLEEGEALCYYCYLRRKLHYAKFDGVKKARNDNKSKNTPTQDITKKGNTDDSKIPFELDLREKLGIVPSTIDLANLDKWKKIMECVKNSVKSKEAKEEKKAKLPRRLPIPLEDYNECDDCKAVWYRYAIKERFFVNKVEDRKYEVKDEFKECLDAIKDVNLYYAIVKGDSDFIGKRVWKGIIKMSLEDYIKAGRKRVDDENLLNDFANKFRDYLRNVYKCSEESNNEVCKNINNVIPITPDYLIAVSRSLMLVALMDSKTVSKYGVVVYAGGDDVAFLSPLKMPVEDPHKGEMYTQIKNTAIGLVKLTRRNYWEAIPGETLKIHGFMYFKNGIFDLPALYGRSYAVFIAHYKDPFYAMWGIASELEEKKDEAEAGDERQKDLIFVLGGRGMLDLKDAAILENRIKTFKALEALYENIGKGLSKSFVKDYLSAYEEVKDLNVNLNEYLDKLLDYIIERNRRGGEGEKIRKDLRDLKPERKINEEWRKVYDPRVEVVKAYDYLEE